MTNRKFYFTTFTLGIVLLGLHTRTAFAQQGDTKTIDKFNELNQLLPKEPSSAFPKAQYSHGKVFVPATKVWVNGKDTVIKTPLYSSGTRAYTVPGNGLKTYPNTYKMPTLKPDLGKYRMPVAQPGEKKMNVVPVGDTVGKK